MMPVISDQQLLQQLRSAENASFSLLYRFYYPMVENLVLNNRGNSEDAEDIFQESLLILLEKVRTPEFTLTSSLKTYLYAIARNQWMKRLRQNKLVNADLLREEQWGADIPDPDLQTVRTPEQKLGGWMQKITAHCRKVLHAVFFFREPMDKLMVRMGWKNKHSASNQQYKCIQQLKKEQEKEKPEYPV